MATWALSKAGGASAGMPLKGQRIAPEVRLRSAMRRDGGCDTEEAKVCRAGATLPRICDVKYQFGAACVANHRTAADALAHMR